ncbi:MAG: hypothetical protein R3C45_09765 [Phycisphaerales bacterium]
MPYFRVSAHQSPTSAQRCFRQFEHWTSTPNTSSSIANSARQAAFIADPQQARHRDPKTAFVRDRNDVLPAIERVGGAPVIIKLIEARRAWA